MTTPYTQILTKPETEALKVFWQEIIEAKKTFYQTPGLNYQDWLSYKDKKEMLFIQLKKSIPELGHIVDAWRYVQEIKPFQMEAAILRFRFGKINQLQLEG